MERTPAATGGQQVMKFHRDRKGFNKLKPVNQQGIPSPTPHPARLYFHYYSMYKYSILSNIS